MQSFDLDQVQDLADTQTSTIDPQQLPETPEVSGFSIAPSQNPFQLERSTSQYSDIAQDITQENVIIQSIFSQGPQYRSLRTESPLWSRYRAQNGSIDISVQLATGPQYSMEPRRDSDIRRSEHAFSFRPGTGVSVHIENNNAKRNVDQCEVESKSKLKNAKMILKGKNCSEDIMGACASLFIITILPVLISLMISHFGNDILEVSSSTAAALDYLVQNLNSDPIIEILPVSLNASCPQDFQSLNFGNWPGTENGCNCPGQSLEEGRCQKKQLDECTDISELSDIDIYGWGGSTWCAKKAMLGTDYVKNATCPSGYRECSSGICMKENLECPISSISMTENSSDIKYKLEEYNQYIAVSREIGRDPLVDMDITLNNIPCFSGNRMAAGMQAPYLLLDFKASGCDKYGLDDKFSFKIDYKNQEQVLVDNNFPDQILSLPGYQSVLQSTPAVLSGRKRIIVTNKDSCLGLDANLLNGARVSIKAIQITISASSIMALILHTLIIKSVLIAISRQKKNKCCVDLIRSKNPRIWFKCFSYLGILEILSYIVALVLLFYYESVIAESRSYLQELVNSGCFEEWQPKTVVEDYNRTLKDSTTDALKYFLILTVMSVGTYVPAIVLNGCKKKAAIV